MMKPMNLVAPYLKNFRRNTRDFFISIRVAWFLAVRQIKRSSKGTTGLIIFIMTLTFLNLVVVSGLLIGLISGSYVQFRQSYAGDVLVTPAPGRTYIEDSQDIIKYAKNQSEVTAVSARSITIASVLGTLDENPQRGVKQNIATGGIVGINPKDEETLSGFSKFVFEGQNLNPEDEGYIMIGANLIKEYSNFADVDIPGLELLKGVRVGDKVRVMIKGEDGQTIQKDVIIKAILKSKVDQVSQRMFMLDNEIRRMVPANKYEVQEIAIKAKGDVGRQLADDLIRYTNNPHNRIQTYNEAIPAFLRDIELTFGILGNALSSIALVVASITVFIVVFINAITRKKYIGILKGIGIKSRAITLSYVIISLFYGIIGSAIGLALTFGFLKPFFDKNPIDFPFSDGILVATATGSMTRVAILLFVTILAGFIPAYLIVRKNTLDSILGR